MFLSTFEKQLDAKRRIVVPQDYRAALSGPQDGLFVFPSIRSGCIEGGGQPLFDRYATMADELEFGDELRDSIERNVFGEMQRLSFDTAGRITLPESFCISPNTLRSMESRSSSPNSSSSAIAP